MRLYSGIDLHSNNSVVVVIDEQDRVVYERRHPNDLGTIVSAFSSYAEHFAGVAVESTFNWCWPVDGLRATVFEGDAIGERPGYELDAKWLPTVPYLIDMAIDGDQGNGEAIGLCLLELRYGVRHGPPSRLANRSCSCS